MFIYKLNYNLVILQPKRTGVQKAYYKSPVHFHVLLTWVWFSLLLLFPCLPTDLSTCIFSLPLPQPHFYSRYQISTGALVIAPRMLTCHITQVSRDAAKLMGAADCLTPGMLLELWLSFLFHVPEVWKRTAVNSDCDSITLALWPWGSWASLSSSLMCWGGFFIFGGGGFDP